MLMASPTSIWCLLALVLVFPLTAQAQDNPAADAIARGIEAYRGDRFEEARRQFESAIQADPENAEAHFLLARVYFDTPLRDEGEAARALRRARELDPDNLNYMVAELQQLRTDTSNFFQELKRSQERLRLAQRILEEDPDNGFAHEEFGTFYLRDYYYYRNAISFPNLAFAGGLSEWADEGDLNVDTEAPTSVPTPGAGPARNEIEGSPFANLGTSGALPVNDRFDLETLRSQGIAVLELSRRADKAYEQAVFHLTRALEVDPRRRPVYDEFMRLYALADEWEDARAMLSQMLVYFPEDDATWRYLGLANHRLGEGDASAVSFDEAFEKMSAEERTVFDDITLLLPEAEQDAYATNTEERAGRFWTSEEPRYLTPYNERKLEHYSRLTYADLLYRSDDLSIPGWETERGKIHVRYGVPQSDVVITGDFQEVLEAFGQRGGGSIDGEAPAVENALEGGFAPSTGERVAMRSNRFNVWDYGDFKFVFEDPFSNGEFRLYSPPADLFAIAGPGSAAIANMDYVRIARETFRETPQQYQYQSPGEQIGLPYLVTAFKGTDGRTDLYVHYGIPIAEAFDAAQSELVDVNVKTGAFLISDERDLLVERRRTLYGLKANQVEQYRDVQLWTDTQPMQAPPGTHTVSVEFETVGGGASSVQRRPVEVPDFSSDGLALSSVMLAYAVEETDKARISGSVVRNGLAIKPAPWSVFDHEDPIYVFFEVYSLGLQGGRSDYEVQAEMRPKDTSSGVGRLAKRLFGGRDRGVSTAFPVQSDRRDDAQYVILDAQDQEPGFYTLTLQVTDKTTGRNGRGNNRPLLGIVHTL